MRPLLWLIEARDPWSQCTPASPAERLAIYERRLGEHRARQRLRAAATQQIADHQQAEILCARSELA